MRLSKIFFLSLIALVLMLGTMTDFVDAKRSGGSSSRSSSSRSSSRSSSSSSSSSSRSSSSSSSRRSSSSGGFMRRSSYSHYTGVIIISDGRGGYMNSYGNMCPEGCAITPPGESARCGTYEECRTEFNWVAFIFIMIFFFLFLGCVIFIIVYGKRTSVHDGSYHSHHSHSHHSHSSSSSHSRHS